MQDLFLICENLCNLRTISANSDRIHRIKRMNKIKRNSRATKKLNTPGIISHITQRAAGKELLFIEDSDYLVMIKLIKEVALNYALEIYAFCLMWKEKERG